MPVIRYKNAFAKEWDDFVRSSRNGTFLHLRSYMEYHADRFVDHSLVFRDNRHRIVALLPANACGEILYSHQGLTYGGLILSPHTRTAQVQQVFLELRAYMGAHLFSKLIYKCIPPVYHRYPAEEDLFELFRSGGRLLSRTPATVVSLRDPLFFSELRKRGARKARQAGCTVEEASDMNLFWQVLSTNLKQRFNASPVHSLEEIQLLHSRFPENIRCFQVLHDKQVIAGTLLYDCHRTLHTQYISAGEEGRSLHALDLLFEQLLLQARNDYDWFDFGTSAGIGENALNMGLISQKEGFGGRSIMYDQYELSVNP